MSLSAEETGFWAHLNERSRSPTSDGRFWSAFQGALDQFAARPRQAATVVGRRLTSPRQGTYYVLKQPRNGAYLRLSEGDFELWSLMDGTRTLRDLVRTYFETHRVFAFSRVVSLIEQLRVGGFLVDQRPALYTRLRALTAPAPAGRPVVPAVLHRLAHVELRVPGMDTFVGRLVALGAGWLYRPLGLMVSTVLILIGLLAFGEVLQREAGALFAMQGSYGLGLVALALAALLAVVLHELAHAVALKAHGGEVRRAGFLFYFGLPTFFVDTSDAWMGGRSLRLLVTWAGPHTDLLLGGLAALGALITPAGVLHDLLSKAALVFYLGALLSLNPLLEFDGYYLISDWLDLPRLRALTATTLATLGRGGTGWRPWVATLAYLTAGVAWIAFALVLAATLGGGVALAAYAGWTQAGAAGRAPQLGLAASLVLGVLAAMVALVRRAVRTPLAARVTRAFGSAGPPRVVAAAALLGALVTWAEQPALARGSLGIVLLFLAAAIAVTLAREDRGRRLRLFLLVETLVFAALFFAEAGNLFSPVGSWLHDPPRVAGVVRGFGALAVALAFALLAPPISAPRYRPALAVFGLGVGLYAASTLFLYVVPMMGWLQGTAVAGLVCFPGALMLMRRPAQLDLLTPRRTVSVARDDTSRLARGAEALADALMETLVFHLGRGEARRLERRFRQLATRAQWDLRLAHERLSGAPTSLPEAARIYRAALEFLVATIVQRLGTSSVQETLIRAFDALPWEEREVLTEHTLGNLSWAAPLLGLQRRALSERLDLLRRMPLLREMDALELTTLASCLQPFTASAGRQIITQGESGDRFYIVDRGVVEVWLLHPDGMLDQVAVLGRGDYFGERALLSNARRAATCTAATPVSLFALGRADFDRLLRRHLLLLGKVGRAVEREELLAAIPAFSELTSNQAREVADRLRMIEAQAGEVILHQDEPADRFFIIQSGRVRVSIRGDDGVERLIGRLGPAEHFGEMALLEGATRSASVVAEEPCTLLVLDAVDFRQVVIDASSASRVLERVASRRRLLLARESLATP